MGARRRSKLTALERLRQDSLFNLIRGQRLARRGTLSPRRAQVPTTARSEAGAPHYI